MVLAQTVICRKGDFDTSSRGLHTPMASAFSHQQFRRLTFVLARM
jgi:hypothetical protein